MTGKSGILLIAIGKGVYSHWAANMAASLRYNNPDIPIAIAVDSNCKKFIPQAEMKLYDHVIEIETGKPGWIKLNMDLYSPFEKTMYLDVDGLCVRDIKPLFELCEGKAVASQVVGTWDETAETWTCQWMGLPDVKKTYKLPEKYNIQEINSSFMYFEKGKKADKFFKQARENYNENYKTIWGGAFPDELAYNVATAQVGIDLDLDMHPINFLLYKEVIPDNYFIGLYGALQNQFLKTYRVYERYSTLFFSKVMGYSSPYKYHNLMKKKYILEGKNFKK